ncbi:unnamed protein product, partial [Rotaria magnacalcarata]
LQQVLLQQDLLKQHQRPPQSPPLHQQQQLATTTTAARGSGFRNITNVFFPSNLTTQTCSVNSFWTIWFNLGKPNRTTGGDYEDMSIILAQNQTSMYHLPFGLEAQLTNYLSGMASSVVL